MSKKAPVIKNDNENFPRVADSCEVKNICTCSLWPWGKYTTRLPTGGNETSGPAQACHSSEFMIFFSPIIQEICAP
jgi:hypothetical protein